jgi:beta-galactosidase
MPTTVSLGRDGLVIDGQPVYLLGAVIHYFRYPRGEWRELLLKARGCGVNTIDTVIPWNLHEPREGQFYWNDEADLAAYLDLCQELGLWAIVRPAPYICAEWENGGLPAWLTARTSNLRVDDEDYLAATERWLDAVLPLIVPRQATHGGPVILCQIENEHWASGRYGSDTHQTTLARAAEQRGIAVPQYTCMGGMPGYAELRNGWNNIAEKLVQTRSVWPDNPMMVSELWSGWFDSWGASSHTGKSAASLDRTLHQLTAVGSSGWSHWMLAGGTNWGYWGGRTVGGDAIHMTTSYDYDAPISEYGGLKPKYFVARRHHFFLATLGLPLATVLADATPGGPQVIGQAAVPGRVAGGGGVYRNVCAGAGAPPAWRNFTATYLENSGLDALSFQLFVQQPAAHLVVEVEAASVKPIVTNMPLGDTGLLLHYHTGRLLGFWQQPTRDVLVVYGQHGELGELALALPTEQWSLLDQATSVAVTPDKQALQLRYTIADHPTVVRVGYGERELHLVLLTQARAERLWPLRDGSFLCGPHYVVEDAGALRLDARGEQPIYQLGLDGTVKVRASQAALPPSAPQGAAGFKLGWERVSVAERFDEAGWQPIERPVSLDALGCYLGYGWYHAAWELPDALDTTLLAPGVNDRATLFVDGAQLDALGIHPWGSRYATSLALPAGRHELRVCVDNLGRFNYGSNTGEQKGLLDTLYVGGQQHDLSQGWTALWQEAVFAGEALADAKPWAVRPDAVVDLGNFAFSGPSVWLLRAYEARPGHAYQLIMTGDRNPGALFVNGVAVARFSRHRGGGLIRVRLDELLRPGTNVLALNIQGYAGYPWRATLLEWNPANALLARWSFRPGITPGANHQGEGMAFWRARFAYNPLAHGAGPFYLALRGLGKGQLFVNGRNLGRYWHIGPQERYKLPATWLEAENELLIFDEAGGAPAQVRIGTDELGRDEAVQLVAVP